MNIAHINADGVVKICVDKEAFKRSNTALVGRPGIGHLDPKQAIDLMGDLQYSSSEYMIVEYPNSELERTVLKADKFTLPIKFDRDSGKIAWTSL